MLKITMEWRKSYLDLILIPLAILTPILYHVWLWCKIRAEPYRTEIGLSSAARQLWVASIMKNNEKKNIVAVQTIRNEVMGATLMGSMSVLLCMGLAAVISSTYKVKLPMDNVVYGAIGDVTLAIKYSMILFLFISSFIACSLSVHFFNQVNFLINVVGDNGSAMLVTPEYVFELLERSFTLNTVGNRIFYTGLPLLLWVFGPVIAFLCSLIMVPVLYSLDIVGEEWDHVGVWGKV